jgi:hypothetical protein
MRVGGCGTDHHLRVQQPGGLVDEGDDLCELFGDKDVGLGGGLKPVDLVKTVLSRNYFRNPRRSRGDASSQWT